MALIYNDNEPRTQGFAPNPYKMNPIKQWLKHYGNYLYLKFIYESSNIRTERMQATHEMQIAQKKMDYWYKMIPRDDIRILIIEKNKIRTTWNLPPE